MPVLVQEVSFDCFVNRMRMRAGAISGSGDAEFIQLLSKRGIKRIRVKGKRRAKGFNAFFYERSGDSVTMDCG
jgi:hypothetical protein